MSDHREGVLVRIVRRRASAWLDDGESLLQSAAMEGVEGLERDGRFRLEALGGRVELDVREKHEPDRKAVG